VEYLVQSEDVESSASHEDQLLKKIQSELSGASGAVVGRLKKTPLGDKSRVRRQRDLSTVAQYSGGHAKA
jgi:hypothetical protein